MLSKRKDDDIPLFKRANEIIARIHDYDLVFKPDADVILPDPKNPKERLSVKGLLSTTKSEYQASDAALLLAKRRIDSESEDLTKDLQNLDDAIRIQMLGDFKNTTDSLIKALLENKTLHAQMFLTWADRLVEEGILIEGEGLNSKLRKCLEEKDDLQKKLDSSIQELETLRAERNRHDRLFPSGTNTGDISAIPP